jgi:hypothetical protein
MVAGVVLAMTAWGWRRSSRVTVQSLWGAGVALLVVIVSGLAGWDPARAVGEVGLVAGVVGMVWLASRTNPPRSFPTVLGLGLAGLAVWGLWQVGSGLETLRAGLDTLPEGARAYAEERLASRRAFASLPLPSHLAVLLATALPLLLVRARKTPMGVVWACGAVVAMAGLVATRSPVGVGLAVVAVAALLIGSRGRLVMVAAVGLALALVVVVAVRPDVLRLEPVTLRVDNWRTAIWLWGTAPSDGVGVASFAQATQTLPLDVGNRPAHAHSLPLEGLAELGPVGLLACLALALGLFHVIRALWARERALAVAVAVVPLHNLVDFSIFVSGVALPWALLLGWAMASRGRPAEEHTPAPNRVLVVLAAAIALALTSLHATSVMVERAAADDLRVAQRFDGALRALRLAPWRVEPQFLLATAALEADTRKHLDLAWEEMETTRWFRPRSAALAERRARVALARGAVSTAASELWAAVEEGVPDPSRRDSLDELMTQLGKASGEPPN